MADVVPVLLEKYDDQQDIDVSYDEDGYPVVNNHDELSKTSVIRGMKKAQAREYYLDIVTPSRSVWRDEFEDIELGEEYEL